MPRQPFAVWPGPRGPGCAWRSRLATGCSRTEAALGPAPPQTGPGTGTGGTAARLNNTSLCLPGRPPRPGLLSPRRALLPASRPARDKGACGGLAAPAGGPRFPRQRLLAPPCQGGRRVRPRSLGAGRGPGRTPPVFICKADPVPAPSSRPGQAGAAGSAADNGRARARPPDSRPLLQGLVPMG